MSTWSSKQSSSCPRPLPIAAAAEDIVLFQLSCAPLSLATLSILRCRPSWLFHFTSTVLVILDLNIGERLLFLSQILDIVPRVVSAAPNSPINLPELKSNCCKNQKPPETEFDIQMVEDYRKYLLKICTYAILAQPWLIAHFRNTNKPKNCVTQIFGNGKNDYLVLNQNISGDQHQCFPLSTNQRFLMIVNMRSILSPQEKSVQGIMVMAKCKCRLFLAAHNRIC